MTRNIAEIIHASQDALIVRDVDQYVAQMAEDVVLLDPSAPPLHGREAAKKFIGSLLGMFTEMAFVDRKVFPVGNDAAMRFTLRITTASGKEGTLEGVDIFEFNEAGLIQKVTSYYDPSSLAGLVG